MQTNLLRISKVNGSIDNEKTLIVYFRLFCELRIQNKRETGILLYKSTWYGRVFVTHDSLRVSELGSTICVTSPAHICQVFTLYAN